MNCALPPECLSGSLQRPAVESLLCHGKGNRLRTFDNCWVLTSKISSKLQRPKEPGELMDLSPSNETASLCRSEVTCVRIPDVLICPIKCHRECVSTI